MTPPDPIDGAKHFFRPMLPLEIGFGEKTVWVDALVDSGADCNMAPLELAEYFNISLDKYPKKIFFGIDPNSPVETYVVPVHLKFGGHKIDSIMCFGGSPACPLLGQKGFFDKVKRIDFQYPKYCEIKKN